jgi:uncharacterized protein with NRDE domain
MCTVVILRRPAHEWPIVIAANRDEMASRPWLPPARHWPDRAEVTAGLDQLAGGTWLGVNDLGVVAGVLNRRSSLGPDPALRSRGELVLEALDHADATDAAAALADLDGRSYRSFNMFVADNRDAYWVKGLGPESNGGVVAEPLPEGVSMLTSFDLNDPASPRVRHYLPQFEAAEPPDPSAGDWSAWEALVANREFAPGSGPEEAMVIMTARGFGTLSGSLVALPAIEFPERRPVWRFVHGRPGNGPWREVNLSPPTRIGAARARRR